MRKQLIEGWIKDIESSFGRCRPPISEDVLEGHFVARDYTSMVAEIRRTLALDLRVILGLVNSGGEAEDVPAWIDLPVVMPMFGTQRFRETVVTLYLRKSFLQEACFPAVVAAIAHEFSHVVLNSVHHPLRGQEEVVDLTAMILGFRDFFLTSDTTKFRYGSFETTKVGYLTMEEKSYAASYMTYR